MHLPGTCLQWSPRSTPLELDGTCADCQLWIAPELLSKEPLAAAVRDNDDDWKDVVEWVWFGMVTAEGMSITSDNYATADTSVPAVDRLLNSNLGLGTEATHFQTHGCRAS